MPIIVCVVTLQIASHGRIILPNSNLEQCHFDTFYDRSLLR